MKEREPILTTHEKFLLKCALIHEEQMAQRAIEAARKIHNELRESLETEDTYTVNMNYLNKLINELRELTAKLMNL